MGIGHSEGEPKPKQEGAGGQCHSPSGNETGLYQLERQSGRGWEQKRPASSRPSWWASWAYESRPQRRQRKNGHASAAQSKPQPPFPGKPTKPGSGPGKGRGRRQPLGCHY